LDVLFTLEENQRLNFIDGIEKFNNEVVAFDDYKICLMKDLKIVGAVLIQGEDRKELQKELELSDITNIQDEGVPILVVNKRPSKFKFTDIDHLRENFDYLTKYVCHVKETHHDIPTIQMKEYFVELTEDLAMESLSFFPKIMIIPSNVDAVSHLKQVKKNIIIQEIVLSGIPENLIDFFLMVNGKLKNVKTISFDLKEYSPVQMRDLKIGFDFCANLKSINWELLRIKHTKNEMD
jgi:hypothetical protein